MSTTTPDATLRRCHWVTQDALYQYYHDHVWGRPERDPLALFEKLCLDGQQAGLSWLTILKKQQGYRDAFADFNPVRIAAFTEADTERLLQTPDIVRNRLKVQSIIRNARAYLALTQAGVNFTDFIWQFTGGRTRINAPRGPEDIPTQSPESEAMSRALKKAGFSFVGPTICYAFMQACGLINDHLIDCHCREDCCAEAIK